MADPSRKLPSNGNTNEANLTQVQKTRKQLNAYTFDASIFLEGHISTISVDSIDPEKKLFALFDKLTKQFTELSMAVEDDVSELQNSARHTEKILLHELDYNSEKLMEVGDAVDGVKLSFDLASEGAVRIGGKLSSAERERSHIDKSIELLAYIKIFQETPSEQYNNAVRANSTPNEVRECLPVGLQKKSWGVISEVLHDLKKILFELTADDIKNAQNNIGRVADRVEMELLGEFEKVIIKLIAEGGASGAGGGGGGRGERLNDPALVERARELAEWLHLFNFGQSIQKRYIFTVVQHRIPNDSFFRAGASLYSGDGQGGNVFSNASGKITAAANDLGNQVKSTVGSWFFGASAAIGKSMHGGGGGGPGSGSLHARASMLDDNSDGFSDNESDGDGNSAGGSTLHGGTHHGHGNNNIGSSVHNSTRHLGSMGNKSQHAPSSPDGGHGFGSLSLMDHLSGLFSMINAVCQEQFSIIRAVFPAHTVAKVTRMLIQRIFNDPAFGIQARVDGILCPAPPQPALSLPDYLDALVIVREKLSALYLLLLECCSHPSMRGMGSESAALKKAKFPTPYGRTHRNNNRENNRGGPGDGGAGGADINGHANNGSGGGGGGGSGNAYMDADEEAEEILHSDAEIREFFDDQVSE